MPSPRRAALLAVLLASSLAVGPGVTAGSAVVDTLWVARPQTPVMPSGYANGDPALGADGTAFYPASTTPSDTSPHDSLFTIHRPGGSWRGPLRVVPEGVDVWDIVGGVAGDGTVWLAWSRPNASDPDVGLWIQSVRPDGTRSAAQRLSQRQSFWYDLAVNDAGHVAVIWRQFGSGETGGTFIRRKDAAGWKATVRLGPVEADSFPRVEVNPAGDVFALWTQVNPVDNGTLDHHVRVYRSATNSWRPSTRVAESVPPPPFPSRPDIVISRTGHAVFAWYGAGAFLSAADTWGPADPLLAEYPHTFVIRPDGTVVRFAAPGDGSEPVTVRTRDTAGNWTEATVISADGNGAVPDAFLDPAGNVLLGVHTTGHFPDGTYGAGIRLLFITPQGGVTTGPMTAGPRNEDWVHPIAGNAAGDALVVASNYFPTDPTLQAHATGLDRTGPTTTIVALPRWSVAGSALVRWTDRDVWSAPSHSAVLSRLAGPASDFGPESQVATTTVNSRTVALTAGRTTCLRVRGTDSAGHVGPASASTCTVTPLDDRSLTRSPGWTDQAGSAYYLGTRRLATRAGATLSRSVQARRLALVATTCSSCGVVDVFLGQTRLKRISLVSSTTRHKVVIPVATFSSLRSGTVRVVVASRGRPVGIDGLGVSRN